MKVLILGSTGFIGLPAAQAFVRAGHIVYGQTRSSSKANQLAAEEIIPVVASPDDMSAYSSIIPALDAVIDAVRSEGPTVSDTRLTAFADAAQALRHPYSPKLTYIFTSGTWVHGENRDEVVSDTTPPGTNVPELVAWRPEYEQRVIKNANLNGIVIRPSLLYGRSASILAVMFKSAAEGQVRWPGTPGGRLALVHCDDLAEVYVLAAEKAAIAGGKIFDATNDVNESTDAVMQRLVEVSGAKGYEYFAPSNLFEVAMTTTAILRPYLARALLGWRTRKAGLLDHLDVYYKAWQASEGTL